MFELLASLKTKFANLWNKEVAFDDRLRQATSIKYEELFHHIQCNMLEKWLDDRKDYPLGKTAFRLWVRLYAINPLLPPPEAGFSDDGKVLQFVWDRNEHHLDIDIENDPKKAKQSIGSIAIE